MTLMEVAVVSTRIGDVPAALAGIESFVTGNSGRLVGAFVSEIGALNKVTILREFEDDSEAIADRQRTVLSSNPYGVAEVATDLRIGSYVPFPFLPSAPSGDLGPFYEIRTYGIKLGKVAATVGAWENAIPARIEISPLVTAIYSLDGSVPHFINIWPSRTLDERVSNRARAVDKGIWPPQGGPAALSTLHSEIALPAPFSPLC